MTIESIQALNCRQAADRMDQSKLINDRINFEDAKNTLARTLEAIRLSDPLTYEKYRPRLEESLIEREHD